MKKSQKGAARHLQMTTKHHACFRRFFRERHVPSPATGELQLQKHCHGLLKNSKAEHELIKAAC